MPIIPNFPFQTLYGGNKKAAEDLLQQFEFHAHEALRTAGYTWAVVEGERWYIDPDEHIELRGVSVAFHYHQRKRILNEVVAWYQSLLPIMIEQAVNLEMVRMEFIPLDLRSLSISAVSLPDNYEVP